jgi:6-phosphogluconolactonase
MTPNMTRRFFASLLIFIAPLFLSVASTPSENSKRSQYFAFIGTYTSKTDSKGIYSFHFDSSSGQLSSLVLAATTQDPSFLAVASKAKYLYAVSELSEFGGKKSGAVTSYSLDSKSGKLNQLNQDPSGWADHCYVS